MERALGKEWKKDTYYLHYLATHPQHQGRGLGSALMRHVLAQVPFHLLTHLTKADSEGKRCYLEASKYKPNVPIYEHFGFKLVEIIEMTDKDDSVKVTLNGLT
jgi:ribosomal protein S18 acetylase RimI-like enzyme